MVRNRSTSTVQKTNHSDFFFFFFWLRLVPDYSVPCSHLFNQIHVARLPENSPGDNFLRTILPQSFLHVEFDNLLRTILPQSFLHVERAAHPRISWRRFKDVCIREISQSEAALERADLNLHSWQPFLATHSDWEGVVPLSLAEVSMEELSTYTFAIKQSFQRYKDSQ